MGNQTRVNNVFFLAPKTTSFFFYSKFLPELYRFLIDSKSKGVAPEISFEKVEYLDPLVLPNLVGLGCLLKKKFSVPTKLRFSFNPTLLNFLKSSWFTYIVDSFDEGLGIFIFDRDMFNSLDLLIRKKNWEKHKIHVYDFFSDFYSNRKTDQIRLRDSLFEEMRYIKVPSAYKEILLFSKFIKDASVQRYLDIFSEILCNCILYSESKSFAFFQSTNSNVSISISDIGIGFEQSLMKKEYNFPLLKQFGTPEKKLHDFYIILEALNYSKIQAAIRDNLWTLKKQIISLEGIFRIHYNSTQLIFTSNRCGGCEKDVTDCASCLLNSYTSEQQVSPLRFFDGNFRGVHIEIIIPHGATGTRRNSDLF